MPWLSVLSVIPLLLPILLESGCSDFCQQGFPESPRQLIEKDNDEEALRVLKKLHATGLNDEWINSEFQEIRQTILAEKALVVRSWTVMFTVPQWRNRLMHGVMVQVFTQLTGISGYSIRPFYVQLPLTSF